MAAIILNDKHDVGKHETSIFHMLANDQKVHFIMMNHDCEQYETFEKVLKGEFPFIQIFILRNSSLLIEVYHLVNTFNVQYGIYEDDTSTHTPPGCTLCPVCNKETRV